MLITRVINFELVQLICSRYINVTYEQTDRRGQTDGRTTYDRITALALRASRGKIAVYYRKFILNKTLYLMVMGITYRVYA